MTAQPAIRTPRPRRRAITFTIAAAVVVGAVVALVLTRGNSRSTHKLDRTLSIQAAGQRLGGLRLEGTETGTPAGDGTATLDLTLRPVRPLATANTLRRERWFCFPITQEALIHCAPPRYLQRKAPDVPLLVFDRKGTTFLGTEHLIRNDVYRGDPCPFEGAGRYHATPQGYVACHEFSLSAASRAGYRGTADQLRLGGWLCFPITAERLIHCAPPGYLQRRAADVPLTVFDSTGTAFLGTEDMIRNDAYRGERCPFEGGGPYHRTPKGYVACHEFPLRVAAAAKTVLFTGLVTDRLDEGTITSFVQGDVTFGNDGSATYRGTGAFTVGTKTYTGVTGRYRVRGTVPRQRHGTLTLTGDIRY